VEDSILVVMALEIESQGLFAQLGVPVLYTGLGKVNAAYRLARALTERRARHGRLPKVVNFGTAGSPRLKAGSIVACRRFVQRDMDVSGLGFPLGATPFEDVPAQLEFPVMFAELPEAVCGTGDRFETGRPVVECDVIDMEAYALAKVCHLEGAEFGAVKFVTDGADGDAGVDWHANLPRAARAFVEHHAKLSAT
jgi:adenosylhomocysteine nucleosidase